MEITHRVKLNNADIEEAIGLFLDANGVGTKNKKLDIDMTAGRKGTGVYATVTFENIPESGELTPADNSVGEEDVLDAVTQSTDPVPEVTDDDEDEDTSLFS